MKVKRNKPHEVYHSGLDEEHRSLYEAAEDLHQALAAGQGAADVRAVAHVLMQRISAHFSSEERLMRESRYPQFEWHKRQHDTMRRRMEPCPERLEAGDCAGVAELLDFFEGWLHDHTGLHDRMMSAYLRNFERSQAMAS